MIEQVKVVFGMTTTYLTRTKGSRRVMLTHKHCKTFTGNTHEIVPKGVSLEGWASTQFYGVVRPVTGLPGKR